MLKVSKENNKLIFIENGDVVALLAAMSASSLPGIPTCVEGWDPRETYWNIYFERQSLYVLDKLIFRIGI